MSQFPAFNPEGNLFKMPGFEPLTILNKKDRLTLAKCKEWGNMWLQVPFDNKFYGSMWLDDAKALLQQFIDDGAYAYHAVNRDVAITGLGRILQAQYYHAIAHMRKYPIFAADYRRLTLEYQQLLDTHRAWADGTLYGGLSNY